MKLKKKTSMMLLAASVAATVGVASVSFAAWVNGGHDSVTANASTGYIALVGFENNDDIELGKLVPYNQEGSYTGELYASKALPTFSANDTTYTLTVTVTGAGSLAGSFYVQIADAEMAEATSTLEGWNVLNAGNSFTYSVDTSANGYNEDIQKYINVVFDSNDKADMNAQDIAFTVSLAEKTATA